MTAAGYSGTPLPRKLGLTAASLVLLVGPAPASLDLGGAAVQTRASRAPYDAVLLFTTTRADLARRFPAATGRVRQGGAVWVCWPKKGSGLPSDLTENVLREVCLPTGWVDVKVCAVDGPWSGLRFLRRRS